MSDEQAKQGTEQAKHLEEQAKHLEDVKDQTLKQREELSADELKQVAAGMERSKKSG